MSQLIVVQSKQSEYKKFISTKSLTLSYHLPKPIVLSEPYVARLAGYSGNSNSSVIYADFVQSQSVNGKQRQLLGFRSQTSTNFWVPVITNTIPTTGLLQITVLSDTGTFKAGEENSQSLIIELAPRSSIYGTQGMPQL